MTQAYIYGMTNAYSSIESGRERMASALIFIARNGHLPRAPIAVEGKDGLQFVDGSHRVVAWVTYREFTENQRKEVGAKEIDPAQAIWVVIQMSETDTDLT
ncbi:hypothetical protein X760_27745 [Mesorhizobium sp. LSHC422A00]|nr:hypothetical protein X760_27745 [Mesorhizobium sp. LSHC422A00]